MQADTVIAGKYALVNNIKMYYEVHGAENISLLVLVHGGGSTIETTFGKILPLLAKKYKVIAVELQGHGHTEDRNAPESFEQDAADVFSLLQQLKIEKANFLGFSNGGNTVMQIAMRHPAIVNRLIIASSFYKREGMIAGFFDGMQHASLQNMPQPLKDAFLKINNDSSRLQSMHDKDKQRMIDFQDWSDDDLRSIKAPSLIIIGNHDVIIPEHAVKMSKLIPNAELVILPGLHGEYLGEICTFLKNSSSIEIAVSIVEEFLEQQ